MRKYLLIVCLVFQTFSGFGQDSIPNGNFERWNSGTYNTPDNYPYSSNVQQFLQYHLPFNITRTTDAYHGTYAVQLTTNASVTDTAFAFFLNINPNSKNGPASWTGGIPYNQKPTGIRGYYKYNVATADSATVLVTFSKSGVNIGTYIYAIGGIHNDYTLFNFTFSPALSATPDSISFGALSCKLSGGQPHGPVGSTLLIDSVSFTGVANQPEGLNGDFETWQSQTINALAAWYSNSNGGQETGVLQTADAVQGAYATELRTYLGNQHNHSAAQPGQISNGYYPNNCSGNCYELGGYPFTKAIDTLAFYYKYLPAGGDSASIYLNFKKNGIGIGGAGMNLHASEVYKYKEIPINVGQSPDSVMIQIQSSNWNDTLISFVGSDLKIDGLHFKSNVITKVNPVLTWDNPSDIIHGTLLGAAQLNAMSNIPGTLVYTPVSGTLLDVGNNQTLSVDFTPVDTVDYNNATKSVTINVEAATGIQTKGAGNLRCYPVPAHGNLNIECPEIITSVVITNTQGTVLIEKGNIESTYYTLSLDGIMQGVYMIKVKTKLGTAVEKIIVE